MKIAKMPDGSPEIYGPVLQGEGMTQGNMVVFVRTMGCNLYCQWCDTYYTWNFENTRFPVDHEYVKEKVKKDDYLLNMEASDVVEKIKEVAGDCRRVVFSGGEPSLQQQELIDVMNLLGKEWKFEIETNGTIPFKGEFLNLIDQINCSPKLESSGVSVKVRNRPEAIASITKSGVDHCFKFVIRYGNTEADLDEVRNWQLLNQIPAENIYLMPEGWGRDEILRGTVLLEEIAINYKYKVSTRLHVLLHGDKRAV